MFGVNYWYIEGIDSLVRDIRQPVVTVAPKE